MNPRRRALVDKAYNVMDVDGSGTVDLADMALAYDVSFHPDFIAKKKTKDQILRELLDVFDDGEKDGVVTREEFAKYYSAISASIDNDDFFELMIRNAWRMSGGEGMAANTANKRVLVTGADGSERVVEVRNEMGLKRGDQQDLMGRLQKQGEQGISGLSLTGSVNNATGGRAGARPVLSSAARASAVPGLEASKQPMTAGIIRNPPKASSAPSVAEDHPLMERLRASVIARGGGVGILNLGRKFRIMDDDNSKSLSLAEFRKGMRETVPGITDSDITSLFRVFDRHGDGSIDYDEFVVTLAVGAPACMHYIPCAYFIVLLYRVR